MWSWLSKTESKLYRRHVIVKDSKKTRASPRKPSIRHHQLIPSLHMQYCDQDQSIRCSFRCLKLPKTTQPHHTWFQTARHYRRKLYTFINQPFSVLFIRPGSPKFMGYENIHKFNDETLIHVRVELDTILENHTEGRKKGSLRHMTWRRNDVKKAV